MQMPKPLAYGILVVTVFAIVLAMYVQVFFPDLPRDGIIPKLRLFLYGLLGALSYYVIFCDRPWTH